PIAQASACALIIPSELLHKNKLHYSINPFSPAIPRLYEGSGHKRTLAPLSAQSKTVHFQQTKSHPQIQPRLGVFSVFHFKINSGK
ncbi:MAG: hypothetical protein K8S16_15280, partial [Bacteroidales bacterium]|nr:hypothetical protein [Bacteroidales bacterium]